MNNSPDWPFSAWLDVAVRIFGLSPQNFWTMSLFDWLTLLERRAGGSDVKLISRQSLSQMMGDFPDRPQCREIQRPEIQCHEGQGGEMKNVEME